MNQIKKEIVDEIIKRYPKHKVYENEFFNYWILEESFIYDKKSVSREQYKYIKQYAIVHGTLPNIERQKAKLSNEIKEFFKNEMEKGCKNTSSPEVSLNNNSYEYILRYSKTYDSLELYYFRTIIRAPVRNRSPRVIVQKKIHKTFLINKNGYVMIGGKRWLSLKNKTFLTLSYPEIKGEIIKKLLISMIGKEWVANVQKSISISNKNSRRANSLAEAIELECESTPAKFLNNFFKNEKSYLIKLYKLIEPNKVSDIITFIKNNKNTVTKIVNNTYDDKACMLLFCYFLSKDNRCDKIILFDYFKMALESGIKINTKISSYSTLKKNHDDLNKEKMLKLSSKGQRLKVGKVFPNIKSIDGLEVEKIKTVERLNQESFELHHCVHTYKNQINTGDSAIYRLTFKSVPYTLQVKSYIYKVEDSYVLKLSLNQLKGNYNCNPPESIKPFLYNICIANHIETESINNLSFKSEVKAKRKVVQIGSKILDKYSECGFLELVYEDEL